MMKEQEQVREFMLKAEQECPDRPTLGCSDVCNLRFDLIHEELYEYEKAICEQNLTEIADAIADLLYVVLGTAVAHGIDIYPIFQEVHSSNMSKFIDGHKDKSGKWIKGPSFRSPDLKPLLDKQIPNEYYLNLPVVGNKQITKQ